MKNISFEFYPFKSVEGKKTLTETIQAFTPFSPAYFSVTFGAGGSAREGTFETVNLIRQVSPVAVTPHLACLGLTKAALSQILQQYQLLGLKRLVALRGDLPTTPSPLGDFSFAHQLVSFIRENTGDVFHIQVAAYPECHPEAKNLAEDIIHLKRKCDAGADGAITQYFYNVDAYFYFLEACHKQGITMPIVPGIMPITQLDRLMQFSNRCGADIPKWLYQRLLSYAHDLSSLQAFGIEFVTRLCEKLKTGGAPGLHLYSLNKADCCVEIVRNLTSG